MKNKDGQVMNDFSIFSNGDLDSKTLKHELVRGIMVPNMCKVSSKSDK